MRLIGAVELEPRAGQTTKRATSAFLKADEKGILIRTTGDIIAMSPPLNISGARIDELIGTLGKVLKTFDWSLHQLHHTPRQDGDRGDDDKDCTLEAAEHVDLP